MKKAQVLGLAGMALVAFLLLATATTSFSQGIHRGNGFTSEGCTCHGPNGAGGVPNPAVRLYFHIDGNPLVYNPGTTYNLSFGAAETDVPPGEGANQGGFNLKVTVGTLSPAPGWDEFVLVQTPTEATHTKDGDVEKGRAWNLTWKAPGAAEEPAIFTLFINTVNGDDSNTEADHWNGGVFVLLHQAGAAIGAGGAHIDPEKIGVNWLAHWVGIISILAVAGTLLIYYFVLKYGESIHTTDHRDRKEK